jgi:hypothetical protein
MSGNSAALAARCRVALACGLCLLAVVFAVEAKTAWFGPAVGPGSAVRAAKALPADMPRVIEHGVPVPDPIHPHIPFAMLRAFCATPLSGADVPAQEWFAHRYVPVSLAAYFSPQIFFRPPPVLS